MVRAKGKYLYFGDEEFTSIPNRFDRDNRCVVVRNTFDDATIVEDEKGFYVEVNNQYDKRFKSMRLLAQWLNENSYRFVGIDDR